jgi:predicted transposase/invertase (TIGR01784 family)
MTEKERKRYEKYIDAIVVERDVMQTARSEGKAEGELQKALEIAQRLKQQGLSIDLISVTTGLNFEQIESL